MHILFMLAGALALLVMVVVGVGMLLPEKHVAAKVFYLEAPPQTLWSVITNFEAQTRWRPKLQRVERLPNRNGHEVWREFEGRHRQLSYETVESLAPRLLVRRIVDEGLPFGGSWTFEITPEGTGSQLHITEHGEVHNLVFRFVSKFLIGHTASMDAYVKNLRQAVKTQQIAA